MPELATVSEGSVYVHRWGPPTRRVPRRTGGSDALARFERRRSGKERVAQQHGSSKSDHRESSPSSQDNVCDAAGPIPGGGSFKDDKAAAAAVAAIIVIAVVVVPVFFPVFRGGFRCGIITLQNQSPGLLHGEIVCVSLPPLAIFRWQPSFSPRPVVPRCHLQVQVMHGRHLWWLSRRKVLCALS